MHPVSSYEVLGIKFDVRELTLAEIRIWMKTFGEQVVDTVDATLFEDFEIGDLRRLTTLSAEDMEGMTPAQLRFVYELCKEVNADFFAMRQRLADLSRQLLSGISKSPSPN